LAMSKSQKPARFWRTVRGSPDPYSTGAVENGNVVVLCDRLNSSIKSGSEQNRPNPKLALLLPDLIIDSTGREDFGIPQIPETLEPQAAPASGALFFQDAIFRRCCTNASRYSAKVEPLAPRDCWYTAGWGVVAKTNTTRSGGSSKVFSKALNAATDNIWHSSTT